MSDNKPEVDGILGCTDHGCIFGHPGGMGTNGGCACLKEVRPASMRRKYERNVRLLRAEIRRLRDELGKTDGKEDER